MVVVILGWGTAYPREVHIPGTHGTRVALKSNYKENLLFADDGSPVVACGISFSRLFLLS